MNQFATFSSLGYMGELGNQMFQVAAVVGYSKKWGKEAIFPPWICKISGRDYSKIFKNPIDQSLTHEKFSHVKFRFDYDGLRYEDFSDTNGNVDFRGYFQSEKYFEHCEKEIRQIFQPNDNLTEYINNKYKDVLSERNKVALHIRTAKREKNDYDVHDSASLQFIEKSQEHFSEDSLYVVFADNMKIAKEMLPENRRYFFVEGEENYVDLFFMTMFEKYIVSPSTFGWWGAWLSQNKKPIVAIKKDWFAAGKPKEHLNDNDIVPDRWIKI
jgi:hypothetical protein